MTVSLYLSSVCDAIAALSVAGVTVKDKNEISPSWVSQPNILYPNPNQRGFITDFSLVFDSVLQGADAPVTISYTLNYRFLGTQIGDMATFPLAYSDVIDKAILIVNAIIAMPAPYSGKVEMVQGPISVGDFIDPAGNAYHGADLALRIKEMHN